MDRYPTTYTDAHGSETTTIDNDGETLSVSLRGIEFVGQDFDLLEPKDAAPEQLRLFTLIQDCLCSCRIECRIPVPVHDRGSQRDGALLVELVLGDPTPTGNIDRELLRIALEYDGKRFVGPGTSGWFEDELLGIQVSCPRGCTSSPASTACTRITAPAATGSSAV